MSWLGNLFVGNTSSTSISTTSNTTGGTFAGVGQTTPSTLPYTTPTTHIVGPTPTNPYPVSGTTVPNGGYVNPGQIPGQVYTGMGTGTYIPNSTYTSTYSPSTIHITGVNPSIATDKVKIDLNELGELIAVLKERFLIITPNFEKHEKYAALKKAYDHYKLLEAMLSGDENDNK